MFDFQGWGVPRGHRTRLAQPERAQPAGSRAQVPAAEPQRPRVPQQQTPCPARLLWTGPAGWTCLWSPRRPWAWLLASCLSEATT